MFGDLYFSLLHDGYRSLQKKRYQEAHVIFNALAPDIDEPYVWFMLALSSVYVGDLLAAERAIQKGEQTSKTYQPLVQLRAFLYFKAAVSLEDALNYYIDLLKTNDDPFIRRMRRDLSSGTPFRDFQKEAPLSPYVTIPSPGKALKKSLKAKSFSSPPSLDILHEIPRGETHKRKISIGFILASGTAFLAILALTVTGYIYRGYIISTLKTVLSVDKPSTPGDTGQLDMIHVSGQDYDLINKFPAKKNRHYYYSAVVMKRDFERARGLIKTGRYNQALILLNRIDNSNVSHMVKEKVAFLRDFITHVENRSYEEVAFPRLASDPWMYQGHAIVLTGRTANVKAEGSGSSFTLLVNSPSPGKFEGMVNVYTRGGGPEEGTLVKTKGIFNLIEKRRLYLEAHSIEEMRP